MSKSTSPRSVPHDWSALLDQARALDQPPTDEQLALWREGKVDLAREGWAAQYVHALQAALEGRDPSALLAMLDAGLAVPTFLLPVLSDVLRAMAHGSVVGTSKRFTVADVRAIREHIDRMVDHGGMLKSEAIRQAADLYHVDPRTIERALAAFPLDPLR